MDGHKKARAGAKRELHSEAVKKGSNYKFVIAGFLRNRLHLIAVRLRKETTPTTRQISRRLHTGSWKDLRNKAKLPVLYEWVERRNGERGGKSISSNA